MSQADLRSKYGAEVFDAGRTLQPKSFERRIAQRDSLDQHYTRLWLDFAIKGIGTRPAGFGPRGRRGGRWGGCGSGHSFS